MWGVEVWPFPLDCNVAVKTAGTNVPLWWYKLFVCCSRQLPYVVRRVLQQIWVSTLKKEVDTELEETQYFWLKCCTRRQWLPVVHFWRPIFSIVFFSIVFSPPLWCSRKFQTLLSIVLLGYLSTRNSLHHLLIPSRIMAYSLRKHAHPSTLPDFNTTERKRSLIIRSLCKFI